MEHSRISPSAAKRWFNCPGSVTLIAEKKPENKSGESAEKGTHIHKICENILKGKETIAKALTQTVKMENGKTFKVSEFESSITEYVDFCKQRMASAIFYSLEHKVSRPEISKDTHGTIDFLCVYKDPIAGNVLCIADLKTGVRNLVHTEDNEQLLIYAVCAFHQLSTEIQSQIDMLEIAIIQAEHYSEEKRRPHYYALPKLLEFEKVLVQKVKDVDTKTDFFCVGEHCTFCPVIKDCPEQTKSVETALAIASETKEVAENIPRMVEFLALEKQVTDRFKAVKAYLLSIALAGQKIPGMKIVRADTKTSYLSEEAAIKFLKANLGDDGVEEKPITITEAKKKFKKKGLDENMLKEVTGKKQGDEILVFETDKRDEIKPEGFAPAIDLSFL